MIYASEKSDVSERHPVLIYCLVITMRLHVVDFYIIENRDLIPPLRGTPINTCPP